MHLVSKTCYALSWMSEMQRKDALKNLKAKESKLKNDVDSVIQEIAKKELNYQKNRSSFSETSSWFRLVEKEYIVPPLALIATCCLDGVNGPSFHAGAYVFIGMFLGSYAVAREIGGEKIEFRKEKTKFNEIEFAFYKKQLNLDLENKKNEHGVVLSRINQAESMEDYLKTIADQHV